MYTHACSLMYTHLFAHVLLFTDVHLLSSKNLNLHLYLPQYYSHSAPIPLLLYACFVYTNTNVHTQHHRFPVLNHAS